MNTFLIPAILVLLVIAGYFRNKQAKSKVVSVIKSKCTECGRCIKMCRPKVLEIEKHTIVLTNPGKCTACGHCVAACKFNALEMVNRKETYKHIV